MLVIITSIPTSFCVLRQANFDHGCLCHLWNFSQCNRLHLRILCRCCFRLQAIYISNDCMLRYTRRCGGFFTCIGGCQLWSWPGQDTAAVTPCPEVILRDYWKYRTGHIGMFHSRRTPSPVHREWLKSFALQLLCLSNSQSLVTMLSPNYQGSLDILIRLDHDLRTCTAHNSDQVLPQCIATQNHMASRRINHPTKIGITTPRHRATW